MKLSVTIAFLAINLAVTSAGLIPRNGKGTQFITGPCTSDGDCASGCCGFNTGKCAGPVIAQERDGGCGFGDQSPNDNAAKAFRSGNGGGNMNNGGPAPNSGSGSGKAPGTQFITGPCGSDADCASGCCGFNTGKCAGPVIAQERDGGCGFGDQSPNDNAAKAFRNGGAAPAPAPAGGAKKSEGGSSGSGKPPGTQFITGPCGSDADCASGCCGFNTGKCAGPVIAQERDGGCGFGDQSPNDNAAKAFRNGGAAPAPAPAGGAKKSEGGSSGSGKPPGTQFITGPCGSDADCASGCCGFNTGKCAGPVIAQERDGGCGFGDQSPNDNAAKAFRNGGTAPVPAPVPAPAPAGGAKNSNSGSGSGKPPGAQFITGPCGSDADCASGCCGFNTGKCAGPVIAQERDGGCGFGDQSPNDNAAKAFRNGGARRALYF